MWGWTFRPTLWPTLFTVPALIALVVLGSWQVQRLHWKEGLLDKLRARSTVTAISLPPAPLADRESFEYRRVEVRGRFLHESEFFLINRSLNGKPGLHVVTPLVRADGRGHVLVNRGWIPFKRRNPVTRAAGQPSGMVKVEGILRLARGPGWFTPENDPVKNTWFWIDPNAMGAGLSGVGGHYLLSGDRSPSGGFPVGHQWRVDIPNDHLQYAITWYALAVALAVIYVVYHSGRGGPAGGSGAGGSGTGGSGTGGSGAGGSGTGGSGAGGSGAGGRRAGGSEIGST